MEAKEVIVAQAVANAELMAERDQWRNRCAELEQRVAEYEAQADANVPQKDA